MLLRLCVTNYRSFRDATEFSMVATRFSDEPTLRHAAPGTEHGALPVMALFGANASGKSNLVRALLQLRSEVVNSFTKREPDAHLPHKPFQLDKDSAAAPTTLSVDFVAREVRYEFGVCFDSKRVIEEWLYAWPEGRRQAWYYRNADEAKPYKFGAHFKGQKKLIAELTRPNSLFLSAGAQHNHEQLLPVYRWFSELQNTEALRPLGFPVFSRDSPLLETRHRDAVRTLLAQADLGVVDFRSSEDSSFANAFQKLADQGVFPEDIRETLEKKLRDDPPLAIELAHQGTDGAPHFFPPDLESHGTSLLLSHCEVVLDVLASGATLVVDELDASLHPRLSAAIVGLFTNPESNPRGAQLIFTTHDESLIPHLRRDEVVFSEKDATGASSLVPLSDFETRKRDDIRQGYADGRFGGVPMLGDLAAVVAEGLRLDTADGGQ